MTSSLPSGQTSVLLQMTQRLALSDAHFRRICQLIYQRAGIVLADHKRDMVYNRTVRRLRATGLDDFGRYLSMLEANQNSAEWQAFINALTTNLTAFFARRTIFPSLRNMRVAATAVSRLECGGIDRRRTLQYRHYAGGCVRDGPGRWKVFASDIDTEVLEKARSGIYRLSELKTLSPQQLQRYFMRGTGPHEGLVRVRQELANYVEFSSVNLLEKQYNVPGPFDAIFAVTS